MTYSTLPPFAAYSGSRKPKMLLIGEAWGEQEAKARRPFVGESGKLLWQCLGEALPFVAPDLHAAAVAAQRYDLAWLRPREAWLEASGIAMTNVLAFRPPENKLERISVPKDELPERGKGYPLGAITKGRFLLPEFLPELDRLQREISDTRPNLIVALGGTACWALLRASNIGSIRGAVTTANIRDERYLVAEGGETREMSIKCLPTYHPAGVMRNWSWRPIVVADLMKAGREMEWPEVRRPSRSVLHSPTIEEIETWTNNLLSSPPLLLASDIETGLGQIKCIGFASSRSEAMVIPFVDLARPGGSYWQTNSDEARAWIATSKLLASPVSKLFQNGMYDVQWLTRVGLTVNAFREDSMLLHHSILPEMKKGLGFLGSIYSSEPAWKLMRKHKADTQKADE